MRSKVISAVVVMVMFVSAFCWGQLANSLRQTLHHDTRYEPPGGFSALQRGINTQLSSYRDLIMAANPVAYYRLGELSGTTCGDETTNHDGTYVHSPTLGQSGAIRGDSSTAVYFNGSNNRVAIPDDADFYFTNNFTIEFWVKVGSITQTDTYIAQRALNRWAVIYGYAARKIEFFAFEQTGDDPRTNSQIDLSDTGWHYIVYTYDGSMFCGYRDGVRVVNESKSFSLSIVPGGVYIGSSDGVAGNWFNGTLDEFAFYNKALSASEISEHYQYATLPIYKPTPAPGSYAYVTNSGSNTFAENRVARINLSTYDVDYITVGAWPMGIDITPDGEWVYVVNNDSDTVSAVHTGEGSEIMQIPVGIEPIGVAIDHTGTYAYVTNSTDTPNMTNGTVSVIDISKRTVTDTIPVGRFPAWGIDISDDDSKLAVANVNDSTIQIFSASTRSLLQTVQRNDGFAPMDVRFAPGDNNKIFIAYFGDGTNDHVRNVDLTGSDPDVYYDAAGAGPSCVRFHTGGNWFITSNYIGNDIYHDNLSGSSGTVDVAAGPLMGSFTPDGNRFLLPCFRTSQDVFVGLVQVFDTSGGTPTFVRSVEVGINPAAVAISNQALTKRAADPVGIPLFAEPKKLKRGSDVYLNYSLLPPAGTRTQVGVIVAVIYNDSRYFAYTAGFGNVVQVNPTRTGSIPKVIDKMLLSGKTGGWLTFANMPVGSYHFVVALTDPKTGKIIYMTTSNNVSIE